ncbi:3-isopropylmalate dehydratase small subunit [Tepidibacillus decaturensis]|uniref:3-isopropylmalate dehydratase small subunit n=1 Tax=Tepidibacillus decaturensis TaxID=1413211 RepID=A0A135L554_9BACI|nr:3-isopropylmalate dehydratase small subunit [Tepidibacillus decaturensis]KXG44037.1 3-isopropylmalate dehydratase [Tepidibacillus decaturensis]
MRLEGNVWKFGDDVDTDVIIPARYLNSTSPEELALHCMEDADAAFSQKVKQGDILVAGKNFGCGSSREHAPISIKAAGISCVVAESFARIFYRNAINIGLPILESPEAAKEAEEGDQFVIEVETGLIQNVTKGKSYSSTPFPEFMQELINAGGLISYVKRRIMNA